MLIVQSALHDRSHGVYDIFAGEVVGLGDLCGASRLGGALGTHQLCTFLPKLDPGIGMDAVVYAGVAGDVAPGHTAVRCVHDGIAFKQGDVPPPKFDPGAYFRDGGLVRDPFFRQGPPEVIVLGPDELLRCGSGRTYVHKRTQQPALIFFILRDVDTAVFPVLRKEIPDEILPFR